MAQHRWAAVEQRPRDTTSPLGIGGSTRGDADERLRDLVASQGVAGELDTLFVFDRRAAVVIEAVARTRLQKVGRLSRPHVFIVVVAIFPVTIGAEHPIAVAITRVTSTSSAVRTSRGAARSAGRKSTLSGRGRCLTSAAEGAFTTHILRAALLSCGRHVTSVARRSAADARISSQTAVARSASAGSGQADTAIACLSASRAARRPARADRAVVHCFWKLADDQGAPDEDRRASPRREVSRSYARPQ